MLSFHQVPPSFFCVSESLDLFYTGTFSAEIYTLPPGHSLIRTIIEYKRCGVNVRDMIRSSQRIMNTRYKV